MNKMLSKHNFLLAMIGALINASVMGQTNTFPATGNVGIGTTTPAANLTFKDLNTTSTADGISWYNTSPLNYGIYKTAGTWASPNYQQLKVNWITGIILDPGTAYGKSYVDVIGNGLRVSSGKVGIGTSSPDQLLTINAATGANSLISFKQNGTTAAYVGLGMDGVFRNETQSGTQLQLRAQGAGNFISLHTNGTEKSRITSSGNLGIGTASPANLLHVHNVNVPANTIGSASEIANFSVSSSTGNVANFKFLLNRHTVGDANWENVGARLQFITDITNQGYVEFNPKDDPWGVAIGSGGTELMRFKQNGNIGIGTTNPGPYKLAVEGTLGARKVKITQVTPWADYVFDKNYRLPSLAEVEKFIQQNKHLPDVPSAAEVEKNGLDLGDNQAVLLKKIEELTLYIIEQHKTAEQMKTMISDLRKEVQEIREQKNK